MGLDTSIVIPAFNEQLRLPSTLEDLLDQLPCVCPGRWEIVVSDDGSTDATVAVAERAAGSGPVRVVSTGVNRGKGAALLRGIRASQYDNIVLMDADLPVPVDTIAKLLGQPPETDLVLGSRRVRGASFDPPQPLSRRLGGRLFRLAVRGLGYRVSSDPQCGVKLLRVQGMDLVLDSMRCEGFAFDVELIERSRRAGLNTSELPVHWSHVEGSSLHPTRDAVTTLRDLVALRAELRGAAVSVAGSLR